MNKPGFKARVFSRALIATCTIVALGLTGANASQQREPVTLPATGTFTFTTAPGIVPAWDSASITLTAISPATLTTVSLTATEKIEMPVVAKTGSANALAGGFRLTNTKTRESVNCLIPTLDTKARVLDCVTIGAGQVWETTKVFFEISNIATWTAFNSDGERTSTLTGIELRIPDNDTANFFNEELSTTVFTTSVTIASGSLDVTRELTD
jgi:hypothetical protein